MCGIYLDLNSLQQFYLKSHLCLLMSSSIAKLINYVVLDRQAWVAKDHRTNIPDMANMLASQQQLTSIQKHSRYA